MSGADEVLREAMAAHKAGRLDDAEAGYRSVLQSHPDDPKALYYLGLLEFHRGDTSVALAHLRECLRHAPNHAQAWGTFGSMLAAAGDKAEAKHAYRRVTEIAPAIGEGWYNLAVCLRDEGDFEGAVASFRSGIARQPGYTRSWNALGSLLYELGRVEEAQSVYRDWITRDPADPVARHMAAATSQRDVPRRASDEYVRDLFDLSARTFDVHLARLAYRAPELVAAALLACTRDTRLIAALDAGCGTGLCGPLLRSHCERLCGVDLSAQMIQHAQTRGCYDELVVAELAGFMRSRVKQFDAVVSTDTLVYFGALEEPLGAARETLRPGGVLVFTLEALTSQDDYRLEAHGRYAHNESYVRRSIQDSGLHLHSLDTEVLRKEGERDVIGYIVTCRVDRDA